MSGPLHGIRVVDLTSVVVGPICTRVLADQGAEVVKVEPPEGDLLRTMAFGSRNPGMSGKFLHFNRNKRSLCLDLKRDGAKAALAKLIARADVFVHNMRAPALARLGLDATRLRAGHPRLIHCSILAFGSGGRYADRPAYDPIVQSLSGIAGSFEAATGEPRFVPMVMSDHVTGLIAAQCLGFALFRRERDGAGEAIEVPMFENLASFVMSEHMGPATFDPPLGPPGDTRLVTPWYRPAPTKDGYITISPNTDAHAFAFFEAIGRPELKTDPRFSSAARRSANADAYFQVRAEGLARKTTAEWLAILGAADIPVAGYNSLGGVIADPHLADVGFFRAEQHPTEGAIWRTAQPNRFSGGAREEELPAPRLGGDTRAVLGELGYDEAAIEALIAEGAAKAG